jgi:hypothetical protein
VIKSMTHETLAYDSTQSIVLPTKMDAFDSRTDPDALLRMLREYFTVAQQCSGGLVRIRWSAGRPRLVLLWPPVTMLQMSEPTYEEQPRRRVLSVAVVGGLLVAPESEARLAIAVTRGQDGLRASVELRHFMPRAGQVGVIDWVYRQTQARVHAWVGLRYLRQLGRSWRGPNN